MENKINCALSDEALLGVSGGTSDTDNYKRVKCCYCGEIFMAVMTASEIVCPNCRENIKDKLLDIGVTASAASAQQMSATGVSARMS